MRHEGEPPGGAASPTSLEPHDLARALQELEKRFEALADASVDGVVISAGGQVLEVNRAGAEMLGLQPGDMVAHAIREYFDEPDLAVVAANIAAGREEPYEVHMRHPDGRRIPIELRAKNVQYMGGPARATVVRDISERRKAEAVLGRWEHLFRNTQFGIATLDEHMRFELLNAAFARTHGFSAAELRGAPMGIVLSEKSASVMEQQMLRTQEEGRRLFESRHQRKDGSEFPVLVDLSFVRQDRGQGPYYAMHIRDLSDEHAAQRARHALEERVRHSEKLESLGILAGGIAHDFNNLLVGILGNADLLMHELPPDSRSRTSAENLRVAARRAAGLTQQMLAYSGKTQLELVPLALNDLVKEMDSLLDKALSHRVPLQFDLSDAEPVVLGDGTQLRQVLMNLITNAADAAPEKSGRITVRTGLQRGTPEGFVAVHPDSGEPAPGPHVYMEVSDNGVGMPSETVGRMFEPFFTTKFAGRGLGLAAALGIVRSHRGAILVRSAVGEGTSVRVLLPAASELPEAKTVLKSGSAAWKASGRALVVDDELAVRHVASAILSRAGFEVEVAVDGEQALELVDAATVPFRFVLLDMTMPRMSGAEVYRVIRARHPDIHVLLSSGYAERDAAAEVSEGAPIHFIQKPYEVAALLRSVRRLLGEGHGTGDLPERPG